MAFIHDDQPQAVYDAFNEFIFSSDRKLFGKLASKLEFVQMTTNIPGDIVELGVFKGSGMMGWLKALECTSINHKNVVGFDFFDMQDTVESIKSDDQGVMKSLFEDRDFDPHGYEDILAETLQKARYFNFDLIKGDVTETLKDYLDKNPGFRVSIANFDLDVQEPTEVCLNLLWDRIVPGGILVFDEYGFNEWTESNAVDNFVKDKNMMIHTTKYYAPSAYVVKT